MANYKDRLRKIDISDPTLPERFWRNVEIKEVDDCWEWTSHKNKNGRGRFEIKRKFIMAPRIAWTLTNGEIRDGLCVCHSCDNPGCCNPKHLWLGTYRDNAMDMIKKNRHKPTTESAPKGEKSGRSKLKEYQVIAILSEIKNATTTCSDLAKKYSVSYKTIRSVIKRKSWKHISL